VFKNKTLTTNTTQKDFAKKDFFRKKLIFDVNLDVKIGGGGRDRESYCGHEIFTPNYLLVLKTQPFTANFNAE
jgi:hypothetical protein